MIPLVRRLSTLTCYDASNAFAGIANLIAERGVAISTASIRLWEYRFGAHFAACIRRDRPTADDKRIARGPLVEPLLLRALTLSVPWLTY